MYLPLWVIAFIVFSYLNKRDEAHQANERVKALEEQNE